VPITIQVEHVTLNALLVNVFVTPGCVPASKLRVVPGEMVIASPPATVTVPVAVEGM